ncbi:MAG: AAA family ATPase, partial [Endomicrobiaceae bacterium]|nr:AAA family ATPase [Endomicrobiaceae bacterium]
MLSFFRIQNYRSILDMKVDFSYAEKRAPNKHKDLTKIPFLEINEENRFVSALAIYGANASGKTNIMQAFLDYKTLIRKSKIKGFYSPNKLNTKYNTAIFEIEFFIKKDKYRHFIEYDNTEIKKENLYKNNKIIYEIDNIANKNDFKNILAAEYDNNRMTSILNVECSEQKENNYIQKKVFLSVIYKQYGGLNSDIANAYKEIVNLFVSASNNFVENALEKCNSANDADLLEKTAN